MTTKTIISNIHHLGTPVTIDPSDPRIIAGITTGSRGYDVNLLDGTYLTGSGDGGYEDEEGNRWSAIDTGEYDENDEYVTGVIIGYVKNSEVA